MSRLADTHPSMIDRLASTSNQATIDSPATTIAGLRLPHGLLQLPTFLPDATLGAVRALDSQDLEDCGLQAVVMNTFHLMQHPGTSTVQALGGLHRMAGWPHPIITDSGGFQAYSLIRQNSKFGSLTDNGIHFKPEGADRKFQLTPEKCVQLQLAYGADVVMCLDDCTHVDDTAEVQRQSVQRTIAWARRCKQEFSRLLDEKRLTAEQRPKLFAVVQGGRSAELRRECAERLLEMGFDGYGYGGWPLDGAGNLVIDMLSLTRELIPAEFHLHALGVGHPLSIAACVKLGYGLFDSALPTRDARHARLYTFVAGQMPATLAQANASRDWLKFVYIGDDKFIKDSTPVDESCDCLTCQRYTRGYLHHLYKQSETNFMRLATLHNLRFMVRLLMQLGKSG